MTRIIIPAQFWDRTTTEQEITVPQIEFRNDVDENSTVLIPKEEPTFIFATPEPGKEGIGIVINDARRGSFTLLLSPAQVAFLIEQLAHGIANLEALRLECQYRGPQSP